MTEKSFFGRTEFKFTEVNLEGGVNVPQFLNACRSYVAFYDLFGGTLFAPVKSDVTGNVTKLQGWYDKDPSKDTLEKLLQAEIEQNTTQAAGSATDALLWLKRGLWMMAKFMQSMLNGERDASKSFTAAYDTTLKPHHNWFVQKAFTVGLKMVPDFQGFLDAMTGPDFKGDKEEVVLREMGEYINEGMHKILLQIDQFYTDKNLKHP